MYKCLKWPIHKIDNYSLIPVRDIDKLFIMEWRNAQLDILRQEKLLTIQDQENYFSNTVLPLFSQPFPRQLLFSFLVNDLLIGYGGLVHIHWNDKRAEVSFLLDNKRAKDDRIYEKEFSIYLTLIKQIAFKDLEFNRLYTETFDIRPHHISVLEKNGFELEGRMKKHVIIGDVMYDSLIHGYLKEYENI